MTKDEALKLALEALKESETKAPFGADGVVYSKGVAIHQQAITAIKEALAQPQQEPVRREQQMFMDEEVFYTSPPAQRKPLTDEQLREALRQCPHDTVENLRVRWLYAKDFAKAIEAAHGIKENT